MMVATWLGRGRPPGVSFEKISTQVARIEIAPENDAETVQHLQELWRRSGVVVKNASSY